MFSEKNKKRGSYKGWTVLWKYLSEYKKELIALSALGTVSALANGTVPYVAGKFFDAKTEHSVFGRAIFNTSLDRASFSVGRVSAHCDYC